MPAYEDYSGAMKHVYLLAFGDFDTDSYGLGDGSQTRILWIFFTLSSFILCLHLLNMLIAIMGETFGVNNEIKRITQIEIYTMPLDFLNKMIKRKETINNYNYKDFYISSVEGNKLFKPSK